MSIIEKMNNSYFRFSINCNPSFLTPYQIDLKKGGNFDNYRVICKNAQWYIVIGRKHP